MSGLLKPKDAKPIWSRSGAAVGVVLVALKGVAPDTPWWGYLIAAVVVVVAEQVFRPSQRVEKPLPRADQP